ncbi:Carbohydrate-binding domain, family 9-like, subgroup [Coniochaeta hoffmannii]|uniref:Carbohydrate-binding domain, family 9-like, subgroup n=1 Tax=Coniochaeta hoffmannii TaxID=91930 RepID=A0AA38VZ41_9PEZI|nr:Carbohydrate-binding domain, family 9-like, subgroup [Coniochaeta hoffmannii]
MLGLSSPIVLLSATVAAVAASSAPSHASPVPSLRVPGCPKTGSVTYNKSVPDKRDFPTTKVDLCYTDDALEITFTAKQETSFYFNASQGTNEPIWQYEVMEAFIYQGTNDPQTYLEFEVNPNNVTFQAFIYNPSKVRTLGAPFDTFFITQPLVDGLTAETAFDKPAETWVSAASIPLGLFNVDKGKAKGTDWRMNFFRTVVSPDTFPDQLLGAWSVPDQASFHMTPFFGNVHFV